MSGSIPSRSAMISGRRPNMAGWLIRHASLGLGAALVGGLVLASLLAPVLTSGSPLTQDLYHPFQGVSLQHPFGTDAFGRDIVTRIVYGARYSLVEAAASIAISCSLGTLLGLAAGAAGRLVDQAIMWLMDILFAFPGVVLALLIVSLLGPGLFNMLLAISLFSVPVFARLARNLSMALRKTDYVEAAVAMGASFPRIVLIHILPNAAGPILVQCAVSAGSVILMAASLSFLGLGVQPPAPEWGAMMSDGRNYVGAYVLPSLFPGLAITLAALGFNLLGEGLRAALSERV